MELWVTCSRSLPSTLRGTVLILVYVSSRVKFFRQKGSGAGQSGAGTKSERYNSTEFELPAPQFLNLVCPICSTLNVHLYIRVGAHVTQRN